MLTAIQNTGSQAQDDKQRTWRANRIEEDTIRETTGKKRQTVVPMDNKWERVTKKEGKHKKW